MHILRYFCYAASLLFILSGCSIFKAGKKSPDTDKKTNEQITEVPVQQNKVENKPEQIVTPPKKKKEAPKETAIKTDEQPKVVKPTRPKITFNETESAHVRIPFSMNNPFPPSGELKIALTELQSEFCYPYKGKVISPFGRRGRSMHTGMDIKAIPNDTIRAALPGVVRMSKLYSGYGNIIVIRHYNGMETAYSHNSKNLVSVNDVVEAGDPIALAGRTGRATTEHLHFEVRIGNEPFNPILFVDPETFTLRNDTIYVYHRAGKVLAYNRDKSATIDNIAKEKSSAVSETESNATNAPVVQTQYHIIKKGDTLYGLARKYSTTVKELCRLNNITPDKILQINKKLRVR